MTVLHEMPLGILSNPSLFLAQVVYPPLAGLYRSFSKSTGIAVAIHLQIFENEDSESQSISPDLGSTVRGEFSVLGLARFYWTIATDQLAAAELHESSLDELHRFSVEFIEASFTKPIVALNGLHEIMISLLSSNENLKHVTTLLADRCTDRTIREDTWREEASRAIATVRDQHLLGVAMTRNVLEYLSPSDRRVAAALDASQKVDFVSVIERVVAAWKREAEKKSVDVRTMIDGERFEVRGNELLLQHMVSNLVSNAVKYSYSSSRLGRSRFISLVLRSHDPGFRDLRLRLAISNYGIGLSQNEQRRIGRLGFRGSAAAREQPLGFGVGVHVAMQIAKTHGGSIVYTWRELHEAEPRGAADVEGAEAKTYLVTCNVILPCARG